MFKMWCIGWGNQRLYVVSVGDEILVKVNHVMEKEHFIEWIALVNDKDICKVRLLPEQNAECKFKYIKGSKLYAYCNKHGLWSCDVE